VTWDVAVIGAGYVGVPLAFTFADAGSRVLLVDVQPAIVEALNRGESHIDDVPSEQLRPLTESGAITATTDYEQCKQARAVLIALPTPLSKQREPDLSYIESAGRALAPFLQRGQVVVLESTTWPGTTREVLQPLLEAGSGLSAGADFHLAMSPERVDPGRTDWTTKTTPKIVGGVSAACGEAAAAVYGAAIDSVHVVSTPEAAELTKLLENIFRAVNIALVNELAQLTDRMDIDVWEVVEAASTKPFGFMSFKPGPGLGGHCIPIDPFYLTWKAREYDFSTRFIELAGEVNNNMPYFCRSVISQAMNHGAQRSLKGSRILVLGVAYKPDIGDMRESPAEKIIHLLENAGAEVAYHDPHVPEFDRRRSVALDPARYNCVVIVTAHSSLDYAQIVRDAKLVVDFRNATKGHEADGKVWKL
jgi:UDP-N-acetyl-D-glucosamine dehydrogenase